MTNEESGKTYLADVASRNIVTQSSVAKEGSVGVDEQVDMGRPGDIMSREIRFELGNTIGIGLLDTTEPSLVNVGLVRRVAIAGGNDTGVYTGRVAVPHLEVDIGHGFASVNVNDLVVNDRVDTLLVLGKLTADVLAADVVRALGDLGGQDAGVVATEEGCRIGVEGVAHGGLVVRSGQHGVEVTLVDATAGTSLLEGSSAAGDVAGINAAGLELGGAVGEIGALHGAEKVAAFLDLLGQIMARVGNDGARQQGQARDNLSEMHICG